MVIAVIVATDCCPHKLCICRLCSVIFSKHSTAVLYLLNSLISHSCQLISCATLCVVRYRVIYFQCLCYLALLLCICNMRLTGCVSFDTLHVSFSFVFSIYYFVAAIYANKDVYINCPSVCLLCFDTVGWPSGRASGL